MKKKIIWIVVLLALVGGGFYWYSKKSKSATTQKQYITETAEKGTLTTSISASGNVVVDQQATVDPTITGTVADLAVAVGDHVEKGQFLFNIINNDLDLEIIKAETSYKQSQNSLESKKRSVDDAEANYEAAKKKNKETSPDTYTRDQLEVLEDKIDTAEDDVALAEKSLLSSYASYQATLEDAAERKVTSPISGTIQEINIKNGDDLGRSSTSSANESPMIIGDLGTLKASVDVNEVDIVNVSVGQKVMITFDALDSMTFTGKVEKIDSLGEANQGVVTYNVTISFDEVGEKIKPQMTLSASIITDVRQNVLLVSSSAIKSEGETSYVEVLQNNTPVRKTVTIGAANDTQTEIVSGLSTGENVITQTIDASSTSSSTGSSNSGNRTFMTGGGGGGIRVQGITTGGRGR